MASESQEPGTREEAFRATPKSELVKPITERELKDAIDFSIDKMEEHAIESGDEQLAKLSREARIDLRNIATSRGKEAISQSTEDFVFGLSFMAERFSTANHLLGDSEYLSLASSEDKEFLERECATSGRVLELAFPDISETSIDPGRVLKEIWSTDWEDFNKGVHGDEHWRSPSKGFESILRNDLQAQLTHAKEAREKIGDLLRRAGEFLTTDDLSDQHKQDIKEQLTKSLRLFQSLNVAIKSLDRKIDESGKIQEVRQSIESSGKKTQPTSPESKSSEKRSEDGTLIPEFKLRHVRTDHPLERVALNWIENTLIPLYETRIARIDKAIEEGSGAITKQQYNEWHTELASIKKYAQARRIDGRG
jgi:hypothetical protein